MRHTNAAPLIAFVLSLAGCSGDNPSAARPAPSALVTTATVSEKTVPIDLRVIGTVEPYATVRIRALASGQLMKVNFKEGQDVKKGDPLFLIDPRPYDEAIRQVEANLGRENAVLRQAEANLQRDIAEEKFARERAERARQMLKSGVLSKEQADQFIKDAESRAEVLRADRAAIESAQASVRAVEAALANAKLQRSYCEVLSPVDGRTGDIAVKAGNLVQANGQDLVTINQVRPVYVSFAVPESYLSSIKQVMSTGQLIALAAPPGDTAEAERGTVTFVNNAVDISTGTIRLKATIDNSKGRLWPGQFVNVTLRLREIQNALLIPIQAVQTGQSGHFVYVISNDQTAEMRPIETSIEVAEGMVVSKGLKAGEIVVTEGHLRLAPGMKVRFKEDSPL